MSDYQDIIYEIKGPAVWVTINRPDKFNAFRTQTLIELKDAFERAEVEPNTACVVLAGAGDKAFCAGGDISEMGELTPAKGRAFLGHCVAFSSAIRNCAKPVIAAVDGFCLGGGHEMHLFCDMTVATKRSKFGQTGPTVGSVPIWGGTQMLPRVVGEKKAREIIMLCRRYPAEEALAMGLINTVVEDLPALEAEVASMAERLMELSPQSLRLSKTSLNFETDMMYASFIHGKEMLADVYGGPELTEGMNAFLEKRKPDFAKFRSED